MKAVWNKKWFSFLTSVLLFQFGLQATDYYVNDNSLTGDIYCSAVGNTSNNGTSPSTPKSKLTEVWNTYGPSGSNVIVAGDIIYVDAGTYFQTDRNLSITIGISIIGAGMNKTLFDNADGGTTGYFFARLSSGVRLEGFKITRYGVDNTYGQAIDVNSSAIGVVIKDIQVDDCGRTSGMYPIEIRSGADVLIDGGGATCNDDWESAGGIHVAGSTTKLTIQNYVFVNNYRVENGSALKVDNGTVILKNCLFTKNTISGGPRGVVYQAAGTLKIYDCLFTTNYYNYSVAQYGGTILVSGGTFYMTRSRMVSATKTSSSAAYGSAVCLDGGSGQIDSCSFASNDGGRGNDVHVRSASLTARYCVFGSASAQIGISGTSPTFSIANCGSPGEYVASGSITKVNTTVSTYTANPSTATYTGSCGAILLPVTLGSFDGQCFVGEMRLTWTTRSEHNNDYFVLERADENGQFQFIARMKGAGNSSQVRQYEFTDQQALEGDNFYRLSQVDLNGNTETLAISDFSMDCGNYTKQKDFCFYNVKQNELLIKASFMRNHTYTLSLVDALGKVVEQMDYNPSQTQLSAAMPITRDLPPSLYFLQIESDIMSESIKVIIYQP